MKATRAFCLFETTIGRCAIGWSAAGVFGVRLPSPIENETRDDLRDIDLDMTSVPEFHRRVDAQTRAVPPGETRTYGEIAKALGDIALSRAIGVALGVNP